MTADHSEREAGFKEAFFLRCSSILWRLTKPNFPDAELAPVISTASYYCLLAFKDSIKLFSRVSETGQSVFSPARTAKMVS